MASYILTVFLAVAVFENAFVIDAKPSPQCGYPCSTGCYSGGYSGCGYPSSCAPLSPPIQFQPVPQPIPVPVQSQKCQSVTIPNIILALLPPNNNNKQACRPRQVCQPSPLVVPLPQPYPVPIQSDCGSGCNLGCGGC